MGVLNWKINCNWPACNYAHILEGGGEIGAVFFDLRKAFDSIPHEVLLEKLEKIGLSNPNTCLDL